MARKLLVRFQLRALDRQPTKARGILAGVSEKVRGGCDPPLLFQSGPKFLVLKMECTPSQNLERAVFLVTLVDESDSLLRGGRWLRSPKIWFSK